MKKLIIKAAIFFLPLNLIINWYLDYSEEFMINKYGPSTQMQIEYSFKNAVKRDYNCLVLGNSRIYRGINPDVMSVPTYNFAHDNDSFNQCYYKLIYLEKHNKKFEYLILGVDYTEFSYLADSRNYIYNDFFDENYRKDFNNTDEKTEEEMIESININNLIDDKEVNQFINDKISRTLPIILEDLANKYKKDRTVPGNFEGVDSQKSRTVPETENPDEANEVATEGNKSRTVPKGFIKSNGQFILDGTANENDTIDRVYKRLPVQVDYFEKILKYCEERQIPIFLVMPPMRPGELKNFDQDLKQQHRQFIENEIKDYNVTYIDYSETNEFKTEDYTDIAHLNSKAADRFTEMLNQEIMKVIDGE